ncbi:MAG: carboxypeptidase regulatory-like domain-containing protein [Acidobacteria bacterium]|nr:carboxypeptidase regulatory-like domain-containing protein [Acidobacteriota bacterium]
MVRLSLLPALIGYLMLSAQPAGAQGLNLSLSVKSQTIVAPNVIQAVLQFRNTSQKTIWLYRPIKNASMAQSSNPFEAAAANATGPNTTSGGSTLEVHLAPANPKAGGNGELDARGSVILTPGFPHPELVRLVPGREYGARVGILAAPAKAKSGNGRRAVWGRYRFSVTYAAHYSNQDDVERELGVNLWHDQLRSNSVTLDLEPPAGHGSIGGTVVGSGGEPLADILATLSDADENPLNQTRTDLQGRFSFTRLGWGRYWVAVRQPGSTQDATVYRHFDLSGGSPQASARLMMLPADSDKSSLLLHKPVLFRVVDASGHPLAGVKLVIVWSTGTAIANFKGETDQEGSAAINLIPGRNFVTLSRRKCTREDRRADVEPGSGVNGFKYTLNCWQ